MRSGFDTCQVDGNVLNTLESKPLGGFTYAALALGVCLAGPLLVHPARASIATLGRLLIGRRGGNGAGGCTMHSAPLPVTAHVVLTATIVSIALVIALCFDRIMVLVSYLGAFCLCPLGLAFPAVALLLLPASSGGGAVHAAELATGRERLLLSGASPFDGGSLDGCSDARAAGREPRRGVGTVVMCMWLVSVAAATVAIAVVNDL